MRNNRVVIGGRFHQYDNGSTPPYFSDHIALWDGVGWQPLGSRELNGNPIEAEVLATVVYNGELYAGGYFTHTGSGAANYLAKFDTTTSSWVPVQSGSEPDGPVRALAVYGGNLYVGGDFSKMGASFATNAIARWTGAQWQNIGNLTNFGLVGSVKALAVAGNSLFVGGAFTHHDGVAFSDTSGFGAIGTYNGSSWAKVGEGLKGTVLSLTAVSGSSDVYVGGDFHLLRSGPGYTTSDLVAKASASGWAETYADTALATVGEKVKAIEMFKDTLYIGGRFDMPGGSDLAKRTSGGWLTLPESPGGPVHEVAALLAVGDSNLVVTGTFYYIGLDSNKFNHIGRWTGTEWRRMGNGFRDNTTSTKIRAVAEGAGLIYVGGNFTAAGDVDANRVASFDGESWAALGTGIRAGGGVVYDLAVVGSTVYAGGDFDTAGAVAANNIASWNGSSWSALSTGTSGGTGVTALAAFGGKLVAGGSFTSAGGVSGTSYCALWDGSAWSTLGGGLPDPVTAFVVHLNSLYAACGRRVYEFNDSLSSWREIGSANAYGAVFALASYPWGLVAGGNFNTVSWDGSYSVSASNVAFWDGSSWYNEITGLDSVVYGLSTYHQCELVAIGDFGNRVARWDGSSWAPMAGAPDYGLDATPRDAIVVGDALYVVGDFWRAAGRPSVHIAKFTEPFIDFEPIYPSVTSTGRRSVVLEWTMPEPASTTCDAGMIVGRYSADPITSESRWNSASAITWAGGVPQPSSPGTGYCATAYWLTSCSAHYFAIRILETGGLSPLGGSPQGVTECSGPDVFCEEGLWAGGGGGEESGSSAPLREDAALGSVVGASAEIASENTIHLGIAERPGADILALGSTLRPTAGIYAVRLHEQGSPKADVDQVGLGVVDHEPSVSALAGTDAVFLGNYSSIMRVTDAAGTDLTATLGRSFDQPYAGVAGDTLTVDLGKITSTAGLVVESFGYRIWDNPDSSGILVQTPEEDGSWTTLAHARPRVALSELAIPTPGASTVRLLFLGEHYIRSLRRLDIQSRVSPQRLSLATAVQSRIGSVTDAVSSSGGTASSMQSSDTLSLGFTATEVPAGKVRDFFLMTMSTLADARTAASASAAGSASVEQAVSPTYVFALGPARPNPSLGSVTIGYSLAQESPVSFRVYNVAGRLVRTLVSGTGEAGPHEVVWDARDDGGRAVPAGVHFYRMNAGAWQSQRKVVFLER